MHHHPPEITKPALFDALNRLARSAPEDLPARIERLYTSDAIFNGNHPINRQSGHHAIAKAVWQPLTQSFAQLRRADDFFTAGHSMGADWISAKGHLHGIFEQDYLGIPATGNWISLRFGEFHKIEGGMISHSFVIFDLPDLMIQSGTPAWRPGLGAPGLQPGPATRDGIVLGASDPAESAKSLDLVERMIFEGFVAADMHTDPSWMCEYWTDDMLWYGPGLIGTAMGLPAFYRCHETPWEVAFTPRGPRPTRANKHVTRFADGAFCSFTGWPSILATHTGDFLGMAPTMQDVTIRVMDFYHRRGDKLDENWVFIDMPHLFLQLGVDILPKMAGDRPETD